VGAHDIAPELARAARGRTFDGDIATLPRKNVGRCVVVDEGSTALATISAEIDQRYMVALVLSAARNFRKNVTDEVSEKIT
jgi:hypothetical protein